MHFVTIGNSAKCTAIGNGGHSLNRDCDILTISLERRLRWRNANAEDSPLSLKRKSFLRHSPVKCHKRSCRCLCHNLSEDQLSKWKQQFLENAAAVFASTDKQSSEAAERIAHLEHLVGRLTVALDIEKKVSTWLS